MNYTLKYRTFEQLLSDVMIDFKKYQSQDMIDPSELIKVARNCNYDLGLRIYKTKEKILEIEKGRAKLPDDFYVFNFAFLLGKFTSRNYYPQGTHMEERIVGHVVPEYQVAPSEEIDFCKEPVITEKEKCFTCCDCPDSCKITCKGEIVQLVQTLKYETRTYEQIIPVHLKDSTEDFNGLCPGKYWEDKFSAVIKDGWIYTSFQTGKLYINYEGQLEDEEGNLLVPDHELLNEYYEYALKRRILENLYFNGVEMQEVSAKIQLVETRYKAARNNANSLVNTPNFREMKSLFQANRNAMKSKYFDMFASYPRIKGH